MSAEEVSRQLVVFKLKAAQDKRLFHLQQEVVTFEAIEDFKVMDLGYVVNTESGVVHGPVEWAEDNCSMHWRTYCGWAFGFSHYEVSLVVPVGAVLPGCLGKGTKRRNFYVVRHIQLFLLVTGLTAELRGAIESASIQQFYQKYSPSSGKTGGIHCKIVSTCFRCSSNLLRVVTVSVRGALSRGNSLVFKSDPSHSTV